MTSRYATTTLAASIGQQECINQPAKQHTLTHTEIYEHTFHECPKTNAQLLQPCCLQRQGGTPNLDFLTPDLRIHRQACQGTQGVIILSASKFADLLDSVSPFVGFLYTHHIVLASTPLIHCSRMTVQLCVLLDTLNKTQVITTCLVRTCHESMPIA